MKSGGMKLASLVKSFPNGFRLGPLDVEIGPGITVLVGPNGAGKSTLMGLCTTLTRPTAGDVLLDGTSVGSRAGRRAARARIGYLPQDFTLPGRATPTQFLHYAAWLRKVPRNERGARVEDVLLKVGLTDRRDERISRLSGGMRRRLGIAYSLVHRPTVIILDEPTVGLDPQQRIQVRRNLRALSRTCSVLVSTHLVDDVQALADRVLVLNQGQLCFDGTKQDLLGVRDLEQDDSPLEKALAQMWTAEQ
ncbi:ATP-binding cassette domain-containing protein [Micromonospora purpureochromogenes]|uniref:ATP-binding cassette domain-containing protein n=1 Tax=Micromonospora purpureochromogenes TaxID=47872 RepID=UPI00331FE384